MKPFSTVKFSIFSSRSLATNPISISEIQHQILFRIAHFSTSVTQFSHSSSSYQSRRHEEESRNVRVSVWWDFENCGLPVNTNVFRVSQSITTAIRASGIKGPVQITAFGDVLQLSRSNQEALSSTGINLTHIPRGGKNSADRSLLVDLMYWVSQNPPPAHLFLISGDRDFASILHRLRMNNYNILLASPQTAPGVLCSAASIMWQWSSLLKGEKNLTVKHFNQPPDGPHGSWYGHYRGNLEDPFAINEELSELLSDPVSDRKGTIPKLVLNHVRQILSLYPDGLSITELRDELGKSNNLIIDRNFYGYKRFSRFLLSMPEILDIKSRPDGQYFVRGKVSEKCESIICVDMVDSVKKNDNDDMDVKEPPEKLPENLPEYSEKVEEPLMEVADLPPIIEKVEKNEEVEKWSSAVKENEEVGYLRRIWKKWFGNFEKVNKESEEKCDVMKSEEVILDEKDGKKIEGNDSKCVGDTSFLTNFMTRCKLWRNGMHFDIPIKENSEKMEKMNDGCGKNRMFSKKSFWKEMRAFMDSSNGSDLVFQSRNRNQMAKNLQNQGPPTLKSLSQIDLLRLIDLLISEKKWITENPSNNFPFKFIESNIQKNPSTNLHPSIFSDKSSPSMKSRDEILADCQELVHEIVKKYPEGFNANLFKKIFVQKYRYSLDIKSLGYKKIVTLLQIMPGAKIESGLLFPSDKNSSTEEHNSRGKKVNLNGSEVDSPVLKILDSWYIRDSNSKRRF